MTTALLLGEDYTELENVAILDLTPNVAIGISRGRFLKGYPYVDPNEDAVFAAIGNDTTILAVADGHSGFDAARAAITAIVNTAPGLARETPETAVQSLAIAGVEAVAAKIPNLPPPRNSSRTALTIAAIDGNTLTSATIGDTACFVATRRRVTRFGPTSPFLASDTNSESIQFHTMSLPPAGTVVVTSDGFTDFAVDVDRELRSTLDPTARESTERLIAAAFEGGAGDNVAVAIVRPIR